MGTAMAALVARAANKVRRERVREAGRFNRDRTSGDHTLGKHSSRRGDFWAHLIADIVVRIGMFFGTAFLLLGFIFGGRHRSHHHWDWEKNPEYIYAILALSTLAAIFGPWLYRTTTHRGRGSFKQVKKESRRMKDEG